MADKAQTIASADQMALTTIIAGQIRALRRVGREAAVVTLGKAEHMMLQHYMAERDPDRLMGLEVKIDGDVGVRVG